MAVMAVIRLSEVQRLLGHAASKLRDIKADSALLWNLERIAWL